MGILIRSHKSPTHGLQLFQTLHALQQKAVKCEPKLFIIGSQCPGDGDGDGDGKIKIKSWGTVCLCLHFSSVYLHLMMTIEVFVDEGELGFTGEQVLFVHPINLLTLGHGETKWPWLHGETKWLEPLVPGDINCTKLMVMIPNGPPSL